MTTAITPEQQWAFIEARAHDLGVNSETLRKWRERGVAHRYRMPIVRKAAEAGIVIDDTVLDHPPPRSLLRGLAAARKLASSLGYYVREGSYKNTTDDRLGRWYIGHHEDEGFRPWGAGHPTARAAWEAALEHARIVGLIK